MVLRDDFRRLLRVGGLAVWIAVGLPVLVFQSLAPRAARDPGPLAAWIASYVLFGLAFWIATSRREGSLGLVLGQAAAVLSLVALPPCFGLEGALLVLVALQLGSLLPRAASVGWILAQSAALLAVVWLHWGWHWAVVLAFAYLPFQLIADAATRLLAEETAARELLSAANAQLMATRELLAQSARLAERARIARDLHDLVGHHLTALSLNLEVASHLCQGEARGKVDTAQSVTKLLLGDVRAAVGALRCEDGLDLPAALRRMAEGIPRPRVHIEVAPGVAVEDPQAAQVLLRCAQEIVTNAVRHAGADNLWLDVVPDGQGVAIKGRDDGCGATGLQPGHGLNGMRERLEERGGSLAVETTPGHGFTVTAILPLPGAAA